MWDCVVIADCRRIVSGFVEESLCRKNNPQTDKQVQTKQQENEPQATKNPYEGMVKSELTGKYIKPSVAKKRPYAIMINNIEYAFRNQKGTSKADIIYEALAEGGITRMMAVYEDVSKVKKDWFSAKCKTLLCAVCQRMGCDFLSFWTYQICSVKN